MSAHARPDSFEELERTLQSIRGSLTYAEDVLEQLRDERAARAAGDEGGELIVARPREVAA